MFRIKRREAIGRLVCIVGVTGVLTVQATAQNAPAVGAVAFGNNYHVSFDRPEAWGLKYFASTTLLSGLQPLEPPESAEAPAGRRIKSFAVGFELGWLPTLDAGQQQIGINGRAPQDLNKSHIFARPVVRVGLPRKLTLVVAAPLPLRTFGVTTHLVALGLERPILQRERWTLSWRGYAQVGSVKGAFTCPNSVLAFAPGSPENPTRCVGESEDVASLRYAGSEVQFAYRIPGMPRLVPHVAAGGNFIDAAFQLQSPTVKGMDQNRLWTRGGTFSGTAGVTFLAAKRTAFTVDAFYSPLWVRRSATAPRTNDGLFNVRALMNYTFR